MKAFVGGSPRLHRFNVCPFGFVGVVRGLQPTDFYENQKSQSLSDQFKLETLEIGLLQNRKEIRMFIEDELESFNDK